MKKFMSIVVSILMVFGISASVTGVFANEGNLEYKVVSDLKVDKNWLGIKTGISGKVNLNNTITASPVEKVEGTDDIYQGNISSSVESADLFEGAYQLYEKEFKGKTDFLNRAWENIVMFNEGGNFPTAQYTIKFPSNFNIDKDAITATENTATISSIEAKYNDTDNSVTITAKLGNWNDYKGFFGLVAGERNQTGHRIDVNIPYTVDASASTSDELGTVTGFGNCLLYKCSGSGQGRIVNITAENTAYTVFK